MSTIFDNLDDYITYPRVLGLAASPDTKRLVATVQTSDEKMSKYVTALWEVDPEGKAPARRLTRSAKGEGGAVVTADGRVLFISARPQIAKDAPEETPVLWELPTTGEARVLASRPAGFSGILAATEADVIVATSAVAPHATDLEDDDRLTKGRKDASVKAIYQTSYPIRYWDHDLGPGDPHFLRVGKPKCCCCASATGTGTDVIEPKTAALTDITPGAKRGLVEVGSDITADGTIIITGWQKPGRAGPREVLVSIDVATGVRTTILERADAELSSPAISPDGKQIAYVQQTDASGTKAPEVTAWVAAIDGSNAHEVAVGWDRWPGHFVWHPSGAGLFVLTDEDGAAPIFYLDLATDKVIRLTSEIAAFSNLAVSPDGSTGYALKASYLAPAAPVRIDLGTAIATGQPVAAVDLLSPVPTPELPGTLEVIYPLADDGTPIRTQIFLPHGASAENPAPFVLWIHGGPLSSWNTWSWRWCPWNLVAAGYALALPDPALSTGYGQALIERGWGSWGGRPYTDLMSVTDAVIARPDIDETRIGAMGGSFGGYMANWVAGHTDRFKGIVSHAGLWALDQFGSTTDMASYWEREFSGSMLKEHSPHRFVSNIVTPMLVIHGDKDYRVPVGEGLRLWYELNAHSGRPATEDGVTDHEFLLFPTENHWVLTPQHAKVWYQVVLRFLSRWILDTPTDKLRELPESLG
ncbi:MAG: prolyl oligopeptidase family serine peptidase [Propionibacteriaceae bacterium]|jgi:dipeptidyl aminopeptidase/acylaminoacyl peptidase|nr:prolyl oligopeptidase family serine peptidase [Propionibacteriaceae bacterium]